MSNIRGQWVNDGAAMTLEDATREAMTGKRDKDFFVVSSLKAAVEAIHTDLGEQYEPRSVGLNDTVVDGPRFKIRLRIKQAVS